MSFIGNIFGAYAARQVGRFNKSLFDLQTRIEKRNAEIKLKTFEQVDKPRIIKSHQRNQSNMLVKFLKSGVDVDKMDDPKPKRILTKMLDENIHTKVLLTEANRKIEKLQEDVEKLIRKNGNH